MFKRSLRLPLRACCASFKINFITKKLLGNKHHIPKWSAKAYTPQRTHLQLEQPFWSCGVSRRISHFHYWIYFCVFIHHKKEHCAILNNVHCSFLMLPHSGPIMVSRASLLMNLIPEGWGQAAPCLNQPMSSILTCNMAWQPWNCPVPPDLTHSLRGTTMTAIFLNLWSPWILRRTELSRQNEPHS